MGVKGDYRIRNLEMLFGEDFVSTHRENGFEFTLDISQVYFSEYIFFSLIYKCILIILDLT